MPTVASREAGHEVAQMNVAHLLDVSGSHLLHNSTDERALDANDDARAILGRQERFLCFVLTPALRSIRSYCAPCEAPKNIYGALQGAVDIGKTYIAAAGKNLVI